MGGWGFVRGGCSSCQHSGHASFPPHCNFVRVPNIATFFFCWPSTKQFEIILVSCRCRCFLKNRLLAGAHVAPSIKAGLNVLAYFQSRCSSKAALSKKSVSKCFNWLDNPEGLNNFFFFYVIGSYVSLISHWGTGQPTLVR